MSDSKVAVMFIALGLVLAYMVGAPLRKNPATEPLVGTPLDAGRVYAEGTIQLTPAIAEKAVNHPTLYLFIRTPQAYAPLAVKRIDSPSFPLSYRLTERDNMAGEGFFDGDITVVARLDADGAAGPKQPDDFESAVTIAKGSDRRADVTLAP